MEHSERGATGWRGRVPGSARRGRVHQGGSAPLPCAPIGTRSQSDSDPWPPMHPTRWMRVRRSGVQIGPWQFRRRTPRFGHPSTTTSHRAERTSVGYAAVTAVPERWKTNAAIVGLGITEMGKIYGRSAADFAAEAVALALEDAGLDKSDIDGLLINGNGNAEMDAVPADDARLRGPDAAQRHERGGLDVRRDGAVRSARARRGLVANVVSRLRRRAAAGRTAAPPPRTAAPRRLERHERPARRLRRVRRRTRRYALAARRHMHLYGTTQRAARRDRRRAAAVGAA